MTSEIGQLALKSTVPAGTADHADGIPESPPPEVLAEVDAAWVRSAQLARENRELHFACDRSNGRVMIEVRSLGGDVIDTISALRALDVVSGAAL